MEQIIKDMILKRGCDVDAGKLPQTLSADVSKKESGRVEQKAQNALSPAGQRNTQTSQGPSSLFVPRPAKQEIRNCMSLDRSLQNRIVLDVANALLAMTEGQSDHPRSEDVDGHSNQTLTSLGKPVSQWNRGG